MISHRGGFIRKKVRSLTLGECIAKIRSERRLSLAEISKGTGIQKKYLEALEKGEFSRLPSLVYVHGFLRSYAKYLGEDPEKFITLFERERGIADNLAPPKDAQTSKKLWTSPQPLAERAITPRMLISLFLGLLFVGAFLYVWLGLSHFISKPQLVMVSPENGQVVSDRYVIVEGKTDASSEVFINENEVLLDEFGVFEERVEIQRGVNVIAIRSVNPFERSSEKTLTVVGEFEENESIFEEGQNTENENFQEGLIVGVYEVDSEEETVEIEIMYGEEREVFSLNPGERRVFDEVEEETVSISSTDGSQTYVILEGREEVLSDTSGEIVREFNISKQEKEDNTN